MASDIIVVATRPQNHCAYFISSTIVVRYLRTSPCSDSIVALSGNTAGERTDAYSLFTTELIQLHLGMPLQGGFALIGLEIKFRIRQLVLDLKLGTTIDLRDPSFNVCFVTVRSHHEVEP